jgi:hypothetical protein
MKQEDTGQVQPIQDPKLLMIAGLLIHPGSLEG